MGNRLEGKVVFASGVGGGGPYLRIAELVANEGATLILGDANVEAGEAAAEAIVKAGGKCSFFKVHSTSEEDWAAAAAHVKEKHGALHGFICGLGEVVREPFSETKLEDWNRMLEINMTAPFLALKALTGLMRDSGGGAIVNLGTVASLVGHATTAYAAARWGERGLMKSVALEVIDWGIRINSVHPGALTILPQQMPLTKAYIKMTPRGAPADPEDLGHAVVYLLSDESKAISGVDLAVDGGFTEFGAYHAVWAGAQA